MTSLSIELMEADGEPNINEGIDVAGGDSAHLDLYGIFEGSKSQALEAKAKSSLLKRAEGVRAQSGEG